MISWPTNEGIYLEMSRAYVINDRQWLGCNVFFVQALCMDGQQKCYKPLICCAIYFHSLRMHMFYLLQAC